MKRPPLIVVQLVHIQGPLKGEIQEFSEPVISVGRHPSSHVQFPKDLTLISRKHAEIVREGNRQKLIDHSTNGTFVNGKKVQERYLKDGDVVTFAEGGPKVSFLTKMVEGQAEMESPSPPPRPAKAPPTPQYEESLVSEAESVPSQEQEILIHRVQVPLVIQYGPTLRSFKELPVTIGKDPGCGFILDHPGILGRHAEIFFSEDQYWVRDLTGQQLLSVNGQPVNLQAPLHPENRLAFTVQGPHFRFLAGGRLAEMEGSVAPQPSQGSHEKEAQYPKDGAGRSPKGRKGILKKFFGN
ncbi:MAG: FHA domain-containing protein [Thermodesulfobacteriota bacterium]|nr:FHA domain-containing protein [Thermodesulfobacteriota bacterium]